MFEDARTVDGLHPFFAVNFLSRYHLTQRLMPALREGAAPKVVMLTSKFPLDTVIDFELFPRFSPFIFSKQTEQIQVGNVHYAAHLARTEPWLRAATVNAGVAKTGIWRVMPWYVKLATTLAAPLMMNAPAEAASNAHRSCDDDGWDTGTYLGKPGDFAGRTPIRVDPDATARVIATCRDLTGA